jgi:hypothetical protein
MRQDWSTKEQDIQAARAIMEQYANEKNSDTLGFFEIVVNEREKQMNFCLSGWIVVLARHFLAQYGAEKGDFVTRQVISRCITHDNIIH